MYYWEVTLIKQKKNIYIYHKWYTVSGFWHTRLLHDNAPTCEVIVEVGEGSVLLNPSYPGDFFLSVRRYKPIAALKSAISQYLVDLSNSA